jgi:hypothetical protein
VRNPTPFRSVALALLGVALFACEESRQNLEDFPSAVGVETRQFIVALRNGGATAEIVTTVPPSNSLLNVPTTIVRLNGAEIQVYEFGSAAETDAAVARLPQILAASTFPSAPHFYRGNRIMVLYVGTDASVSGPIERLIGRSLTG